MIRKILKKRYKKLCNLLLGSVAFFGSMFISQDAVNAMPVEPGTQHRENITNLEINGNAMNITGTGNAFISWKDFSVRPEEIINFSGMTNMLNYVPFKNPSLIYGTINAQNVTDFYIINPSGVLFGPNSKITTGNLFVSTRSLTTNEINSYLSNGTNPLDTSIDTSRINNGGLKSSDIMGAYDIADGDVMFLGQVQANSLKIEGNTIQIRNTDNVKNKSGTSVLQGEDVTLVSNNSPEVGYEVTTDGVTSDEVDEKYFTDKYKYFVASVVGDANMPNSANKLGWKSTTLSGGTKAITDFRLVNDEYDLRYINFSKIKKDEEGNVVSPFVPAEGKIQGNYMLGGDIDLAGVLNFKPLGYNMTFEDYRNESDAINFNGLNFKISNLTMDNSSTSNVGLFSVFSGTLKNLRLQNVNVTTSSGYYDDMETPPSVYAGSLIGLIGYYGGGYKTYYDVLQYRNSKEATLNTSIKNISLTSDSEDGNVIEGTNSGGLIGNVGTAVEDFIDDYTVYVTNVGSQTVTFENIESFADVSGEQYAGGVVGVQVIGDILFKNVINKGSVTGINAGGILGGTSYMHLEDEGDTKGNLTFNRVSNLGVINGTNVAGGLFGGGNTSNSTLTIKQSWNEGNIFSSSDVSGSAGGIAGSVTSVAKLDVDQIFNSADIEGGGRFTGGLFGYLGSISSSATLKNSYNTGKVDGKNVLNSNVGGIVGQFNASNGDISNVYNTGDVVQGQDTGGLIGNFSGNSLKNSYNLGKVQGYGDTYNEPRTGGIIGRWNNGTISNVFNTGNVSEGLYVGGLLGSGYTNKTMTNAYNLGTVTSSRSDAKIGGILGYVQSKDSSTKFTLNNVYSTQTDLELFGAVNSNRYAPSTTNVEQVEEDNEAIAEIYANVFSNWELDKDGTDSSALWRVYENPNSKYDLTRQPLLTAFLQDATIQRYNELSAAGEVTIADLVEVEDSTIHAIHDSDGFITDVRYKNTGKSVVRTENGTRYYNATNPDLVEYDIVSSSESKKFSVDAATYFAQALMKSSQFGYNFKFNNNTEDWSDDANSNGTIAGNSTKANVDNNGTDDDLNTAITNAKTSPEDNAVYLKMGVNNNIPTPPEDTTIDEPTVEKDKIYNIIINVSGGTYDSSSEKYTFNTEDSDDSQKPGYDVDYPSAVNLNNFTITGEIIE
ncbi:MAG: filamentous hemagglutinin N-terminal domain-containing protein, partial [Selenomonadaceae bacterium]|nr:filamentous hemagglutinin N-terminal domain-containing protein [Selenomonadaceae bacterium]